jgi:DNA (cytosine-5)-methyltransferase 1
MQAIDYGSVCSGIEAATVAWHPLGLHAAWYAEIEPFPSAVLAHHYPSTPNLGDMTRLGAQVLAGKIAAPALLVGGTPCQAFSVAGMREGLLDPRGALTIKYVELADAIDHVRSRRGEPEAVIVWENVPGVLSDKGNAFGCFLGALAGEDCELQPPGKRWQDAGCVYGPKRTIAWRILDAQYFGVAQRRRRVFVVASARDGFDPTAVLFEREGVRRDTAPRRGQGQDVTGHAPFGPALQCGCGHLFPEQLGVYGCPDCEGEEGPGVSVTAGVPAYGGHSLGGSIERSATLTANASRMDIETETFLVAPTIVGGGRKSGDYSLDDIPITAGTLRSTDGGSDVDHGMAGHLVAAPLTTNPYADHESRESLLVVTGTLQAGGKAAGSATQQDAEAGLLVVHGTMDPNVHYDQAHTLGRNNGQENALLISQYGDTAGTLTARHDSSPCADRGANMLTNGAGVRRLLPHECERLQGFPDNYTKIPWRRRTAEECPDGPRYKAIGNSKAVPVVRWLGGRIKAQLENT